MGVITTWIYFGVCGIIFLLAHFLLGHKLKLYDTTKWFDKLLHVIAGGVILVPLGAYFVRHYQPWLIATFAFFFSVALAALWEVLEFIIDTLFKTNMQRYKDKTSSPRGAGLMDSMGDIIAQSFGATIACVVLFTLVTNGVVLFV